MRVYSSSVVTLPAGTYKGRFSGEFYFTKLSGMRLRNTTNNTTLALSSRAYANDGSVHANVNGDFYFVLTGTKTIEMQYRVDLTNSTDGLGLDSAGSFSEVNVWASLFIEQVS